MKFCSVVQSVCTLHKIHVRYFHDIKVMLRYCEQYHPLRQRAALLCLALLLVLPPAAAQPRITTVIDADALRTHMMVLADDSLEGRSAGSRGIERAAVYLEQQLRSFGLARVPGAAGYRQTFPLHGSTPAAGTEFTLFAPKDSYSLRLQEDYVLYSAGAQTFTPASVRMVFAGYGIIAPEYDYNDYQSIDVTNAIVVFLSGEPESADTTYFDGPQLTAHSSFTLKQKTALARGARGSILIASPSDRSMDDWYEQQRHFLFEEVRLLFTPSENLNILLNPKLSPFLFTDAPYSFDEVAAFSARGRMKSFPLILRASFQGQFRERDFLSSNILGMIEGRDPSLRGSYLLLTAHYDHLGIGPAVDGDSVYNGAFDNASGVAALLEIARTIAADTLRPRRSILFAFLTGEERGFLGSQYYCLNPAVPLSATAANINIDGISLFERTRSVIGVGAEYSTLGSELERSMAAVAIAVERIPAELFRLEPFRNSDQFMFAQAGIPSMLVSEGLQYERTPYAAGLVRFTSWMEERYHTPADDMHQAMDFSAAAQHTSLIRRFIMDLADAPDEPQWFSDSPFRHARLRSPKEGK